jgi:oligoribonuclease
MTGLDPDKDTIISIACFITDAQLALLDSQGWEAIIHHDQATLDRMDEWCTAAHGRSGLTAASIASTVTAQEAADGLLGYIQQYVPEKRSGLLAGNSVHVDKEFLRRGPYRKVVDHLTYRILDVSAIKEAARRWASPTVLMKLPRKKELHQAKEDVLESIEEARFYRETFFTPKKI